jgi:peptidoglycan/LPS O-acetylase OafA/YrhL
MAPPPNHPSASHFGFLDLLKAIASQLIVLHHLAFYGPMADHAHPLAPRLFDWLASHARLAVPVFLVVSGFLAARALAPQGISTVVRPAATIWRRYVKLAPPFIAAMGVAVAAAALARLWMSHDSIPGAPSLLQIAAHVLFLQSILDYDALSAGSWYVAIDFQLYALLTALLWLCGRLSERRPVRWLAPAVVAAAAAASLLHFNRNDAWDVWAPYFFGSYALGVLAWWASDARRTAAARLALTGAMLLLALPALAVDFRIRIAIALVVALAIVGVRLVAPLLSFSGRRFVVVDFMARISYAVFLVHFPVCMIVNAFFVRFAPAQPEVQAAGVLLAWAASVAAGAAFHRWVELPLGRIAARRPAFPPTRSASGKATPMQASPEVER